MFTKMINDGKSTIRFIEPPHDLCIQCDDKLQLKSFLMVIKKVMDGKDVHNLTLSALQPVSTKQIEGRNFGGIFAQCLKRFQDNDSYPSL